MGKPLATLQRFLLFFILKKDRKFVSITSMKFNIITIFPNIITDYSKESILGRAQKNNLIEINPVNLRDFADNKHNQVDDTPYGGGAGMVLMPEPIFKALTSLEAVKQNKQNKLTILLSPRGKQFDQRLAEEYSKLDEITFVCGRYEGVDQRVIDNMIDEEISVGPYVLSGGELGALIITEAVSRLIPGVLGNPDSLASETHNIDIEADYNQYTKPEDFMGWKVPDVLLSGNHAEIKKWREENKNSDDV
jgi:tRNA (guanine37-N1)-methyltransferase